MVGGQRLVLGRKVGWLSSEGAGGGGVELFWTGQSGTGIVIRKRMRTYF